MEQAADQLTQITGQKSQVRQARVAVSGFRLRENNEIRLPPSRFAASACTSSSIG